MSVSTVECVHVSVHCREGVSMSVSTVERVCPCQYPLWRGCVCTGIFFCLFPGPGRSGGDRTNTAVPVLTPMRKYVGGVASDLMGPPIPTHPLTHNKKHSPFHGVHQVSCFVVVYFMHVVHFMHVVVHFMHVVVYFMHVVVHFMHVVVYFMHVVECSRVPHPMREGLDYVYHTSAS